MSQRLEQQLSALTDLTAAQLKQRWEELVGGKPPQLPPLLLRSELAYQLQARRLGHLPARTRKLLLALAAGDVADAASSAPAFAAGSQLIREWQGRTIVVEVIDGGFMWESKRYRSLSSIAKAVTGAHWSGPRFFGVARG